MNTSSKGARDYLAVILVGAGSSWARGPDKADCIARVKKSVVDDWSSLFELRGKEATVNVVDVTGHDEVWWDHQGFHVEGNYNPELPIEQVAVTL